MDAINQSRNLFKIGGLNQQGGTVDKTSGNDVPPGALQKEVRDDVDAKLSEGEFVFPADVVRYIGLEKLMKIRDMAKKGLQRMNDIGQMGNAEEVDNPEALHGEEEEMDDEMFSSEVDKVLNNGE
jgi:Arc/MetJ-type ribon-helix-helix transcriptional regulator